MHTNRNKDVAEWVSALADQSIEPEDFARYVLHIGPENLVETFEQLAASKTNDSQLPYLFTYRLSRYYSGDAPLRNPDGLHSHAQSMLLHGELRIVSKCYSLPIEEMPRKDDVVNLYFQARGKHFTAQDALYTEAGLYTCCITDFLQAAQLFQMLDPALEGLAPFRARFLEHAQAGTIPLWYCSKAGQQALNQIGFAPGELDFVAIERNIRTRTVIEHVRNSFTNPSVRYPNWFDNDMPADFGLLKKDPELLEQVISSTEHFLDRTYPKSPLMGLFSSVMNAITLKERWGFMDDNWHKFIIECTPKLAEEFRPLISSKRAEQIVRSAIQRGVRGSLEIPITEFLETFIEADRQEEFLKDCLFSYVLDAAPPRLTEFLTVNQIATDTLESAHNTLQAKRHQVLSETSNVDIALIQKLRTLEKQMEKTS